MTAKAILALMLYLFMPGKTLYSQVVVDKTAPLVALYDVAVGGDKTTKAYAHVPAGEAPPPQCKQRGNVACRRPGYSTQYKGWVRPETFQEGLERYWLIASELAQLVIDDEQMALLTLVVTFHESGFRRDVQGGFNHRPWLNHTAQEDSGKSWGLGQTMVGINPRAHVPESDWRAQDIVGLDAPATSRALGVVTTHLGIARERCQKSGGGASCIFANYGGCSAKHPGIKTRAKKYADLHGAPRELTDVIEAALGLAHDTPPAS